MLPSSTHLMPVIGLGLHLATSGNPFHPYVGMVIDPFDYIPFLGSNVNINGLKRGVSDTSGVLITFRHIPLLGAFIMMPIIGHESMNFFSSQTVFAEGTRLSPKGYMVMTCNDVGIPFSGALSKVGKKKFKFTPTLFAPTSFSIPIPTGAPVMVGGPYAPDWGGMLTGLLSSIGFSTLLSFAPAILKAMKKAGKKGGNLSKAYANKARKLMSGVADNMPLPRRKKIDVPKKTLKPGDKYPGWKGSLDYSDIKNPEKAGPNKPFTKKQKDQIYTKNRNAHDGYLVSDMDGTILETPKKSTKGVTPSQYEAQIDHKKPKSKGGENKGDNAQVLSRKQNRDKWDTS